MRSQTRTSIWALLCLTPAAVAWQAATSVLTVQPDSRLWVEGTSTVRAFTCDAKSFETTVETEAPGAVAAVVAGTKAVRDVTVRVPAAQLDCRNGKMNEHMLKALKAEESPVIAFRVASYELAQAGAGQKVTLQGELDLGGTRKPITVEADAVPAAGALRVTGTYEVRMKEFGLKPPTLMLGTLKVNERVKVNFDLLLKD